MRSPAPMLAKLGCTYVVVGHSERRQYHDEDDALVNAKAKAALRPGYADPLRRRGAGGAQERQHVAHYLGQLDGGSWPVLRPSRWPLVIAYEPVWAIGTGEVATPEDAQEVCGAIRGRLTGTGEASPMVYASCTAGRSRPAMSGDHGAAGCRRCARRRSEPGRHRVREDSSVPDGGCRALNVTGPGLAARAWRARERLGQVYCEPVCFGEGRGNERRWSSGFPSS